MREKSQTFARRDGSPLAARRRWEREPLALQRVSHFVSTSLTKCILIEEHAYNFFAFEEHQKGTKRNDKGSASRRRARKLTPRQRSPENLKGFRDYVGFLRTSSDARNINQNLLSFNHKFQYWSNTIFLRIRSWF